MQIGQLTYSYKPIIGGGDVYAHMLFDLFEGEGHSCRVYQRATDDPDPSLRFITNPLACLRKGEFWTQALFLRRLRKDLRLEDIVIAHYPIYLLAAAKLRKRSNFALLGISHGVTWDEKPGSLRARIKRAVARRAFHLADAFVANDTFFLREMELPTQPRQGLFSEVAQKRWFIPNCVPPGFQKAPNNPEGIEQLRSLNPILVPRNLYRNRGVHLAVEAFHSFAPHHPDTHLVIMGKDSQPAYTTLIKHRVKELGLEDRVIFWGHVRHQDMANFYAAGEMCLIPSLCGEGTSLAALEAMACGLAVISTDVAGLKDLPTVQSPPQPEALAQSMLQVYPERRRIGDEQRQQVNSEYSYERWSQTWLEVIHQAGNLNKEIR